MQSTFIYPVLVKGNAEWTEKTPTLGAGLNTYRLVVFTTQTASAVDWSSPMLIQGVLFLNLLRKKKSKLLEVRLEEKIVLRTKGLSCLTGMRSWLSKPPRPGGV